MKILAIFGLMVQSLGLLMKISVMIRRDTFDDDLVGYASASIFPTIFMEVAWVVLVWMMR